MNEDKKNYLNKYGQSFQEIRENILRESNKRIKGVKQRRRLRPEQFNKSNDLCDNSLINIPFYKISNHTEYLMPDWFHKTNPVDVSVIIPLYKSNMVLEDLVNSWDFNEIEHEIIFVDDQCPSSSKDFVRIYFEKKFKDLKKSVGKVIYCSGNNGYGVACNIGAMYSKGQYLIFLNADTKVSNGWISPIINHLKIEDVGIVGNLQLKDGGAFDGMIDSAGSEWSWESKSFVHIGKHIYKGQKLPVPFTLENMPEELKYTSEREMVTGCCFGIRKNLFEKIGGFNPNYRQGYWEDSEICMCVKELGYKILYEPKSIIYHKSGHSDSGGHPYMSNNTRYFYNRWVRSNRIDSIVENKRDIPKINKILIRRQESYGDVLVASGIISALKRKYPGVSVEFITKCPEILQNHPHIDIISQDLYSERIYDVFYDLDLCYEYKPKNNILNAYAEFVGVKKENCEVIIDLKKVEDLPQEYICLNLDKTNWVGRNWETENFLEIKNKLLENNFKVVIIGRTKEPILNEQKSLDLRGQTNLQELAYVIKNAKLLIGIDSLSMHIAQAVNTPSVIFFGSIDPNLRIFNKCIKPVYVEKLNCLGCHHEYQPPCLSTQSCKTGTLDCERKLSVTKFWEIVKEHLHIV